MPRKYSVFIFIFKKNNTANTWDTTAAFTLDPNTGDRSFGYSVAITDNSGAVVGAHSEKKAFSSFHRNCAIGSFNNAWDEECSPCSVGTYSDETAFRSSCKTCETGKSNFGTGNKDCTSCPSGRTLQQELPLVCDICASGQYQPLVHIDSNVKCIACPEGRWYFVDDKQDDTKHDSEDDCFYCPTGYEFTAQTTPCEICSAGYYQNENDLVESKCVACPNGRYIVDDKQTGTEHDSEANCSYCPVGYEYRSPILNCLVCSGMF